MSKEKEFVMQESSGLSQVCASALLDAYCTNDALQMSAIADEARLIGTFYTTSSIESERLELLGGIALELHRSFSCGKTQDLDAYVKLLLHLAHPEWSEGGFGNPD